MFERDNTPPAAIAAGGFAPDEGAAADIAADFAGTDDAPGDIDSPHAAPDDTAPGSIDSGFAAEDEDAEEIAAGNERDDTAAVAIASPIGQPDDTAAGAVSAAGFTAQNEAPRPRGYEPQVAPSTDENVNTPTLQIPGELALNAPLFGHYRAPEACVLERIQIQLQDPPAGGQTTVTLVDSGGVSYAVAVSVPDGQHFAEYVLPVALPLLAGANIRLKCTEAAPDAAGGFGAVTLFTRKAT